MFSYNPGLLPIRLTEPTSVGAPRQGTAEDRVMTWIRERIAEGRGHPAGGLIAQAHVEHAVVAGMRRAAVGHQQLMHSRLVIAGNGSRQGVEYR